MGKRLDGKTALISGAARGQGMAHAALFAAEGASVVIGDVLDDLAEQIAVRIRGEGQPAVAVHLDVTSQADWSAAVRTAETEFGQLNVLVNNAGIVTYSGAADCSEDEWQKILAVNQTGVFYGMSAAIPALRRAGGGSIVNIASITGAIRGSKDYFAYGATKAAILGMTRSAALSYGGENIRVNAVAPGAVNTAMTDQEVRDLGDALVDDLLAAQPIKRLAEPIDISYGVLYLASDEAAFVTGITLTIDGGLTV